MDGPQSNVTAFRGKLGLVDGTTFPGSVSLPSQDSGRLAFIGNVSGISGIYTNLGGEVLRVLDTNDTLEGKAIRYLEFHRYGLSDNKIAFSVIFADLSEAIYVATYNQAPIADAGANQEIREIDSLVELNGTQSYDPDGVTIYYSWTLTPPVGSDAELNDPTSDTPSFTADVHGDYVATLVVTDEHGAESAPDTMTAGFENIKPVADAGVNQSVVVGELVELDGSNSWDANGDPLTYRWSLISTPENSTVGELNDADQPTASFTPDLPGVYVVRLIVNDGFIDSEPHDVMVMAIAEEDAVTNALVEISDTINGFELDSGIFKNDNMRNALTNKINSVLDKIDQGLLQEALDQLENDILGKTNGCTETGSPDKNDWIRTCSEQEQVYPMIINTVDLLRESISN